MPRKVFVAGEILTAADVNTNLMDQAVMVFDTSAARGSAIPSPSEGMVTYLKDTDAVEKFDGSNFVNIDTTGKILQVVSTTLTTVFTVSVGVGAIEDLTGLTATITPTSTNSKILVFLQVATAQSVTTFATPYLTLFRDSTKVSVGNAAGSRQQTSTQPVVNANMHFLDAPNTTSAITYKVGLSHPNNETNTLLVNRTQSDDDNNRQGRSASNITVMEVAG